MSLPPRSASPRIAMLISGRARMSPPARRPLSFRGSGIPAASAPPAVLVAQACRLRRRRSRLWWDRFPTCRPFVGLARRPCGGAHRCAPRRRRLSCHPDRSGGIHSETNAFASRRLSAAVRRGKLCLSACRVAGNPPAAPALWEPRPRGDLAHPPVAAALVRRGWIPAATVALPFAARRSRLPAGPSPFCSARRTPPARRPFAFPGSAGLQPAEAAQPPPVGQAPSLSRAGPSPFCRARMSPHARRPLSFRGSGIPAASAPPAVLVAQAPSLSSRRRGPPHPPKQQRRETAATTGSAHERQWEGHGVCRGGQLSAPTFRGTCTVGDGRCARRGVK